jgi:hypothetical protein
LAGFAIIPKDFRAAGQNRPLSRSLTACLLTSQRQLQTILCKEALKSLGNVNNLSNQICQTTAFTGFFSDLAFYGHRRTTGFQVQAKF